MSQVSSNLSLLLPFVSWSFLPSFATKLLLDFFYSSAILSRPATSHQAFVHNQSVRAIVIVGYLLYSFYIAIHHLPSNFYHVLALPLDVDTEGVKRSFRALARKYHPDKVGPQGESFFILLRKAHDVLQDPVKRFAYDRFGPDVLEWQETITLREHLLKGLKGSLGFYVINPVVYAMISFFGGNKDGGGFWRIALLVSLLAVEMSMLTSSSYPTWLRMLMPNTTLFEALGVMHELLTVSLLAAQQFGPVLAALEYGPEAVYLLGGKGNDERAKRQMETIQSYTQQVDALANQTVAESILLLAEDLRPLRPTPKESNSVIVQQAASEAALSAACSFPPSLFAKPHVASQRLQTREESTWQNRFQDELFRRKLLATYPPLRNEINRHDSKQQQKREEGGGEGEGEEKKEEEEEGRKNITQTFKIELEESQFDTLTEETETNVEKQQRPDPTDENKIPPSGDGVVI